MNNFWDPGVWGVMNIIGMLLVAMLAASLLKKAVKNLADALIQTSVLSVGLLMLIYVIYKLKTETSCRLFTKTNTKKYISQTRKTEFLNVMRICIIISK